MIAVTLTGALRDLIAVGFWIMVAWTLVAGARFTIRQERGLERGRRDYPCSHGAAPNPRWPDHRRPR